MLHLFHWQQIRDGRARERPKLRPVGSVIVMGATSLTLPLNTRIIEPKRLSTTCPFCCSPLTKVPHTKKTYECPNHCGYSVTRSWNRSGSYNKRSKTKISCIAKHFCKDQSRDGRCRKHEPCQYQRRLRFHIEAVITEADIKKAEALRHWVRICTSAWHLTHGDFSKAAWINGT